MQPLEESLKYRQYLRSLKGNDLDVKSITPRDIVRKGNGDVLFAMVNVDAVDNAGEPLLPTALLRGDFVAVLVSLVARETNDRYLLLVNQRRVAHGGMMLEHPAGMCDSETDPTVVALKELEEETGLTANRDELVYLNPRKPYYSSPGLLDEAGHFFYLERTVPLADIQDLQGRTTGAADEGERIDLEVVRYEDCFRILQNSNGLLHLFLYAGHRGLPLHPVG